VTTTEDTATEDVERQVAAVVAVKEPAYLMTVQRIIRDIEIENDLPGRPSARVEGHIDE
jgi:hypothetical protein